MVGAHDGRWGRGKEKEGDGLAGGLFGFGIEKGFRFFFFFCFVLGLVLTSEKLFSTLGINFNGTLTLE